jgi:hypothetical protein
MTQKPAVVVEARIEARFQTFGTRASIFEFLASIRGSSTLNTISFNLKPNGPEPNTVKGGLRNPNVKPIFINPTNWNKYGARGEEGSHLKK